MAKNHNTIWGKMLAAFARDAEPEEIEEAVNAIDDAMNEPEAPAPEIPEDQPEVKDEAPDQIAEILARLEKLEAALAAKDAEEEPDPLKALEDDLTEIEAAREEEEDKPFAPDEDPTEPESQFVDPEQINEQDANPEEVPEGELEQPVLDKRACDALRASINALKPVINKLPPSERRKASDAAVASLRQSIGLPAKAGRNDYLALKVRKKASDKAPDESQIGRNVMAKRNINMRNN